MNQLVLSLFTGVGLLDHQFRKQGFVVVSAGDLITGQDIREFYSLPDRFNGVIGGSPCQDFSGLKRIKTGYSMAMLSEFKRVVIESSPDWFLLENVKGVPDIEIEGYQVQRIDINQGWYENTSRLRHIQFGSKRGLLLDIERGVMHDDCKPLAIANDNRSFAEVKHVQGLPDSYDLPEFTIHGKKKAVGNGVPVSIAHTLAVAVKESLNVTKPGVNTVTGPAAKTVTNRHLENVTGQEAENVTDRSFKSVTVRAANIVTGSARCPCGCYRKLYGRKKYYDASCRKRAQRKRDSNLSEVNQ